MSLRSAEQAFANTRAATSGQGPQTGGKSNPRCGYCW
jgi:hypothetical protein